MAQADPIRGMELAVRNYIQACNDSDAGAISACFSADATHYRPGGPKWAGASTIGNNFATRVAATGQWWTVDRILTDANRCEAVLEWTRFDPKQRQIVRGVDWFVFDPESLVIREVMPYLATVPDPKVARHEQQDFDYAGRGYPVDFPER